MVKNPSVNAGDVRDAISIPGSGRVPWSRKWQPAPTLWSEESLGQRRLVGSMGLQRVRYH